MSQDLVFNVIPRTAPVKAKEKPIRTGKMVKKPKLSEQGDVQTRVKSKAKKQQQQEQRDDGEHNIDIFV